MELLPDDPFLQFLNRMAVPAKETAVSPLAKFALLAGNPRAPGRRFLLLVFSPDGQPVTVIKAGTQPAASELIEKEMSFLRAAPAGLAGVPKLRDTFDHGAMRAFAVDFIAGDSPRPDQALGIEPLLNNWLAAGPRLTVGELPAWERLARNTPADPLFDTLTNQLRNLSVQSAVFHGDLAPWNIKVSRANGSWTVLDWERGELAGPPAWDWFHYALQPAILVQHQSVGELANTAETLLQSPAFRSYAQAAGLADRECYWLLAYLLYCRDVLRPAEGSPRVVELISLLTEKWARAPRPATSLPTRPDEAPTSGDTGATDLTNLVTNIFQAWGEAGIRFVILRNYEGLPACTTNDIDVLIAPEQLQRAEQILVAAAQRAGYHRHNRQEFASLALFFYHPETLHQLQIDLYPDLPWRGFATLTAEEVLRERVDHGLFAIPHPAHEAVISLLGRLLQHGTIAEKYKPAIVAGFQSDQARATAALNRIFGASLAETVLSEALRGNWAGIEQLTTPLRRALVWRAITRRPCGTARSMVRDVIRLTRRFFAPGGMTLVVLGADGSGKSTVAALAVDKLRATFPPAKGIEVHWKPVVFFGQRRRGTGQPNVDPHGQRPRGRVASLLYLTGHWLEFLLGSQLQFRPVLFRGGLVLIDRYYYDFLIDQRRYRLQVPTAIVRALFFFQKQPDLVFLLDAPADVLQNRKREVSPAETARQVEAYRRLVTELPQGRLLDATQPAENVATGLTRQVLAWLETRTDRRGT